MRDEIYSPLNQLLSATLRRARLEAGITQAELAKLTGRTQAYISKFERGQLRLDVGDFLTFTGCLNVDPGALLKELQELQSGKTFAPSSPHKTKHPVAQDDKKWTSAEFIAWLTKALENAQIDLPSDHPKALKKDS